MSTHPALSQSIPGSEPALAADWNGIHARGETKRKLRNSALLALSLRAEAVDLTAVPLQLAEAGVKEHPEVVLADAGYWSNDHIDCLRERGITPIVAPDADRSKGPRKTRLGGPYDFMRGVLKTTKGADLYSRRQAMVEPVFADIKQNRRAGRFKRRGRAAVRSEWRLIAATHNLLKLHRHTMAAATA